MPSDLKELIRLWMTQKRRDFSWRTFLVSVFLTIYFLALVIAVYIPLREHFSARDLPFELPAVVPLVAVAFLPGDLMMKLFWRRSPVEMDDYLRSRPVSPRAWSWFVLMDSAAGFLQWMLPCFAAFVGLLVLPFGYALLLLLLTFSVTMVNALFQNCWRRAPGNQYTLPLVFAYLFWLVVSYAVAVACFVVVGMAGDDASTPVLPKAVAWGVVVFSLLLLAVNVGAGALLQWYFRRLKNHNEEFHAPVHATARSLGEVSVWSIEWVQLLRSKRLRTSVLFIAIIFLLNTYLQQMTSSSMEQDLGLHVNPMLLFGVAFPSIILAQWVLGIEANFFSGIWTKPWPLEDILRRKYVFFCGLCLLMTLLMLPAVVWMHLSPLALLATLFYGCGVFVLPFMATCLFSSRMDLFSSAFFNYQGGNKQLNIFSFIMFIPMGIYYASYIFLPLLWAHLLIGGLGVLGLLLHRPYIHWIATLWFRRRYKIMERWQTE